MVIDGEFTKTQKTNNMKAFVNSLRPSNPFFQRLDDGQRERFNFSSKNNWWIDWNFKFKRLTISFGRP